MTMLEKIGVVIVVVAVIAVVGLMSWSLLRPSKVPPRGDVWSGVLVDESCSHVEMHSPGALIEVDGSPLMLFEPEREPLTVTFSRYTTAPAFRWPHREPLEDVDGPVRAAFRRFLEGGPDYYHQEG